MNRSDIDYIIEKQDNDRLLPELRSIYERRK